MGITPGRAASDSLFDLLYAPVRAACPALSCAQIVRMLERINIYEVVPRKWVFVHTYDGVRAAMAGLDDGENGFSASGKAAPAVLNKDVDHTQ